MLLFYAKSHAIRILTPSPQLASCSNCQKMLLGLAHSHRRRRNWHVTDKAPPFVFVAQCHRQAVQSDTCFTGAFGPQDHCVYTACLHQIFITSFQRGDLSKRRVGTGTITCKCTDRKTDVWPQLHAQVPAELEVKAALHSGPRSVPAADTVGFSFPSSSLHTRPAVLSNVSCSHNHK